MSPSPQGYRQPWEEPSPEREVFDEMLRRPYEELHAENQRLRGVLEDIAAHVERADIVGEDCDGQCAHILAAQARRAIKAKP